MNLKCTPFIRKNKRRETQTLHVGDLWPLLHQSSLCPIAARIDNKWNSFVPESKQSLHMLSELGDVAVTSFYYIHLEINNDHCNLISSHWYDLFTKRTIFARNRIFFPANAKALPRYNNQSDFEASSGTNQILEKWKTTYVTYKPAL